MENPLIRRSWTVALIVAVAFFISIALSLAKDESECVIQVKDAVRRLNLLYLKHHLEPLSENVLPNHSSIYDPWLQINIRQYWLGSNVGMQCNPKTCEVVNFLRTDIVDNSPLLDHIPMSTWSLEKLTIESKPWIEAVLGHFPANLASPTAKFDYNIRDAKRFYSGEWSIRWPRFDSQGHPFEANALAVIMSEKYGLVGCYLNFSSSFQEFHGVTISSKDALAAAASPAQTLLDSRNLVGGHLPEGLKLGTPKAELFVANPNNIFQCKSMDQFATKLNARLAWDVNYPLLNGDIPDKNHTIIIKIDAETKEILGGDFK